MVEQEIVKAKAEAEAVAATDPWVSLSERQARRLKPHLVDLDEEVIG